MPSEMRAKPSLTGSPHRARRSTDVWMPPKLVDGDEQGAALDQAMHGVGVGEFDDDQAAEALHLRDRRRRATGSSGRPG